MSEGGRKEFTDQPMGFHGQNLEGGASVNLEKESKFEEHNKSASRILDAKEEKAE